LRTDLGSAETGEGRHDRRDCAVREFLTLVCQGASASYVLFADEAVSECQTIIEFRRRQIFKRLPNPDVIVYS